ncbi:MAG: OmpA family protein [Verrucomicrobiota bacterium]
MLIRTGCRSAGSSARWPSPWSSTCCWSGPWAGTRFPRRASPALELRPEPFVVKQIEVNPDALKPQEDPTQKLPAAEPPRNPAEFNLDPTQVEKALQTPQPNLAAPTVPEPTKVIAATDLGQGLPLVQSDSAQLTAEISKIDPASAAGPVTSARLAQDLISSSAGPSQLGTPVAAQTDGNGTSGKLPGFSELAPGFKTSDANLAHLPEPVLLRLPSDVLFDFDSATLKPEADALLSQAVAMIMKFSDADVHIDGYSDSFGRQDYNLTLSEQRARAVQDWLAQRVPQTSYRFKAQGHGGTDFIVSAQGSIDQQQPNRRVEILIQAMKP